MARRGWFSPGLFTLFERAMLLERIHDQNGGIRFAVVMLMTVAAQIGYWIQSERYHDDFGEGMFGLLNGPLYGLCLLMAGIAGGVSIAEEREARTMSLLRIAGTNPWGLILGKSVSLQVQLLSLLMLPIPFAVLTVALEGPTMTQVVANFAWQCSLLLAVANVGTLCSVLSPKVESALATLGLLVSVDSLLTQPFGAFPSMWGGSSPMTGITEILAAVSWVNQLTQFLWRSPGPEIWNAVISNLIVAAGCFVLSGILLPWFMFDSEDKVPYRLRSGIAMGLVPRSRSSEPAVWDWAITWKDFHFLYGGWWGVTARAVGLGAVIGVMMAAWPVAVDWHEMMGVIAIFGWIGLGLELLNWCNTTISSEVKDQTLADLLGLPKSVNQILLEKAAAGGLVAIPALLVGIVGTATYLIGDAVSGEIWDYPWGIIAAVTGLAMAGVSMLVIVALGESRSPMPLEGGAVLGFIGVANLIVVFARINLLGPPGNSMADDWLFWWSWGAINALIFLVTTLVFSRLLYRRLIYGEYAVPLARLLGEMVGGVLRMVRRRSRDAKTHRRIG